MDVGTELARLDLARERILAQRDPVLFARMLGFVPDAWQRQVLEGKAPRLLLNCARQSGKSTTAAILALFVALSTPKALVLIVSPSDRQSGELLRKVVSFLRSLRVRPKVLSENQHQLEFANGSRIISLPCSEETIRGYSAVSLIIEDEAGDVTDDLYRAVRPMLAVSNGRLVLMGTPKGRRGHFFEAWEKGGDGWQRITVRGDENPRIKAEFLAEERVALGDAYRQEFECQFIDAATGLVYAGFSRTLNVVDRLPPDDGRRPWEKLVALDFGIVDRNAVAVLQWRDEDPTVYITKAYKLQASISDMAAEVSVLEQAEKPNHMVGDVGGMGKAFEAEFRSRFGLPLHAADKHNKLGYIGLMNADFRRGRIKLVERECRDLIHELETLPWAEAAVGKKEAPDFDNHACDAALYGWRKASVMAGHNEPRDIKPRSREEAIHEEVERYWDVTRRRVEQNIAERMGDYTLEPDYVDPFGELG